MSPAMIYSPPLLYKLFQRNNDFTDCVNVIHGINVKFSDVFHRADKIMRIAIIQRLRSVSVWQWCQFLTPFFECVLSRRPCSFFTAHILSKIKWKTAKHHGRSCTEGRVVNPHKLPYPIAPLFTFTTVVTTQRFRFTKAASRERQ